MNWNSREHLNVLHDEVHVRQEAVLSALPANDFKLRRRFENQAGFSAEVSLAGLMQLINDPRVESIEPVYQLELHLRQGIPLMKADTYRSTYNGAGTAIAICDTGIDYHHPMLGNGVFPNSKVIGGYDFGDGDSDPMPDSSQPHGTCCAGIAAGNLGDTGDYIGGVAYNAKLYALKVIDSSGYIYSDYVINAWNWCVSHKNDNPANPILVISNSFGSDRYYSTCDGANPSMTTAVNSAVAAGITVLVSSGNDGFCDSISEPACISSVISVGAVYDAAFGTIYPCVNANSCVAKTYNTGCSTNYYATDNTAADMVTSYSNTASFLTLLAPSNQCYTTDIVGSGGYSSGDYYSTFGGTSAACPYAAGAVACLQSAAKARNGSFLSPSTVKTLLISSGNNITDGKVAIAKPRINLGQAINSICTPPEQATNPSPADSATDVSITATLNWTAGTGVTTHDVYFGTVSPPPFVGNQPGTTFNPGTLSYGTTYYWRINERNTCDVTIGEQWRFKTVNCPPLGQASSPNPADHATNVDIATKISWTPGLDATSHDVYFGTVSPPPFVVNQPGTTFDPEILRYGTTYYWRIDERNACSVTTGEEWSFTAFGLTQTQGEIIGWGENTYGQAGVPLVDVLFAAVSGGYYHSLGLKADRTIVASGRNDYGQCNVPEGNDFNAIAAGGRHSLGLKMDGSIVAWGYNAYGQCDVPVPNTGFVAIAAGYSHSLGLKADGSIVAWGRNDYGQCTVPAPNSGFIAVAAGSYHSLGLKWNGKIVAWGNNAYGQCSVPVPNSGFKAVEGGAYHSLGLKQDGSVAAWGNNGMGQCTVPAPNSGFIAVSGGAYHSMGLKNNGAVVAWGYNGSGQCTAPSPNSGFEAIAAGGEHCLAIFSFLPATYTGDVNYSVNYQQIEGFGGAGCYYVYQMTVNPKREEIYDLIFRDLGLEFFRIFNSYDYGYSGGNAGWNDLYNDMQVVQAAKLRNPSLKIEMSAWSPPFYLKSNGDVRYGGTLATDEEGNYRYGDYAQWWADAVNAFTALGMKPDYISIQNELDFSTSWESCLFDPAERGENAGYNVAFETVYQELYSRLGSNMPKMIGPETMGIGPYWWNGLGAAPYIFQLINANHLYGYCYHLYADGDGTYNDPDSKIDDMQNFANTYYGQKPIYMTEYAGTQDLDGAVKTAWHIHNAMVYGKVSSYFYWSLWWQNNVDGAIMLSSDNTDYTIYPTYYAIKHYSRYTGAGWTVVGSSTISDDLRITAFKSPTGDQLTVVVVNKSSNGVKLAMDVNNFSWMTSVIYRSSANGYWQNKGAFNPSGLLLCPRQSITTVSLWSSISDCDAVMASNHRLAADIGGAGDCYVNFDDFKVLAEHWLENNCGQSGNCGGADLSPADGIVNAVDFADFARQWRSCNDPKNPNCTPNW
ncbi:MAG: S8 family serine peptidase [Sedimentisphaerales bacterium]